MLGLIVNDLCFIVDDLLWFIILGEEGEGNASGSACLYETIAPIDSIFLHKNNYARGSVLL